MNARNASVIRSGNQHGIPHEETLKRLSARKSNIIRTEVQDMTSTVARDDHIVLIMGRDEGHLIWRQTDTDGLLGTP